MNGKARQYKDVSMNPENKNKAGLRAAAMAFSLLLSGLAMPAKAALQAMDNDEMSATAGQGLLVSDKIAGATGTGMTFYSMILNGQLGVNLNIDKLQLGCGGFNEAITSNACDIDIDYVSMLGRTASGTGGTQASAGSPGAGDAGSSQFMLNRPYLQFAIKNDDNPIKRSLVGFKIGAVSADGFMGFGQYFTPGSAGAPTSCTGAASGSGPYNCHMGINRLSGSMNINMSGDAYGCFGLFGCSAPPPPGGAHVASFSKQLFIYGTRMNRIQLTMPAQSDPDTTLGLTLTVNALVNTSLRMLKGMVVKSDDAAFQADDFFLSFQREATLWPTTNKSQAYSAAANPGWWFNFPNVNVAGLKAYGVEADGSALFTPLSMIDPDFSQRAVDNCLGSSKFC